MELTPTQQKAFETVIAAVRARATPLIEVRSPPTLARGHGVTTVLRAVATSLGVPLLGVSTALETAGSTEENELSRAMHGEAMKSLESHGVAVIDDLDLAAYPRSMVRSRNHMAGLKNAGEMWNWGVPPKPAMLLKVLSDDCANTGRVVVFSSVEDAHLPVMSPPLAITLGNPTQVDYVQVLKSHYGAAAVNIDASAIYSLHSSLAPGDLVTSIAVARSENTEEMNGKATGTTSALLGAVRAELTTQSAVAPEDVESVDLTKYPGLDGIGEELEKQVLFPLENPDMAKEMGLVPKRGVLIHGPPGTGKTTVGRWLAHRLKGKFFLVREMMVSADIIKVFAAAKAAAPAVVFIDDADIIIGGWRPIDGGRGSDIFRFLLSHLDGITSRGEKDGSMSDVVVMMTGQDVKWMAAMLLRSGRIELWLRTKLPGPKQKQEILRKYIREDQGAVKLLCKDDELPSVKGASICSDNFCCADLRRIVSDAKIMAAWDRRKMKNAMKDADDTETKTGSDYLTEAAEAVRDMKNEVEQQARKMYV